MLLFFSARLENEFLYEGHKQKIKKPEEKRDDQGERNHEHRERDGLFLCRPVYMAHFRSCFFEIFGYFHAFDFPLKKPLAGRSMASSIYPLEIEVNPCAKPTARTVLAVGIVWISGCRGRAFGLALLSGAMIVIPKSDGVCHHEKNSEDKVYGVAIHSRLFFTGNNKPDDR